MGNGRNFFLTKKYIQLKKGSYIVDVCLKCVYYNFLLFCTRLAEGQTRTLFCTSFLRTYLQVTP